MHRNAKFVVELEWLGPDYSPEPETEVAVDGLGFRGDVKNVLTLV